MRSTIPAGCALFAALFPLGACLGQEKLHFTYLWHLEQPIYWPDRQVGGADRYETAWGSIQRTDGGAAHPANNLRDIFGLADRTAAYQYRCRDSISAISSRPEAGAQISFSGGLIENITSIGNASQLGYGPTWYQWLREARSWNTAGTNPRPRCDIVQFSFHHALLPLLDDSAIRKELQLYKAVYADAWGSAVPGSRGFFPSEMAFSTRLIEPLAAEGIQWTLVSGEKVSRACADFPVVIGSGGINCDPPNAADKLNPAQGSGAYFRQQIDRGCSPAEAFPMAFTPHRARWVNPDTGVISSIIVIPSSQSLGWKDGYAPIGTSYFDQLQLRNDPSRPMLVMMAHDGDNAWGGGYSYYMEATPNLVSQASSAGYVPTVVEKYLADHPVPAGDYIHVEDGAWVNADGDFGSPQMLNWNWPLLNAAGDVDIAAGWHEDERNWAVITAANNRVQTAEQIATRAGGPQPGGLNIRNILYPQNAGTTAPERAWHYFLGSLNSGYMYYGTALDLEVKPTIACNEAVRLADSVIGDGSLDSTPPTVWLPQRFPWNPGSTNFGPHLHYQQVVNNGDFWIWTFVHDVSGVASVNLKYRIDADGVRPLGGAASTDNETYAGGPGVGAWQSLSMTRRVFPAGNVYANPSIDFFEAPAYVADQYSVQVIGLRSKLIDYYVEATDTRGRVRRSPIQHVYVGDGTGATGGGGGGGGSSGAAVSVTPAAPIAGQNVTVTYNAAGRPLAGAPQVRIHYGTNGWTGIPASDPVMTVGAVGGTWQFTLAVPPSASVLDVVFNNGAGVWDNNAGADWHFPVTGTVGPAFTMEGQLDPGTTLVAQNGTIQLRAKLVGDVLYVAAPDAGEGNDHFIFLAGPNGSGPLQAAQWAKAGQVARWDAFLADENDNAFSGWFDQGAGVTVQNATTANGGWLEGTINVAQKFGSLPERVYLAFAPYPTANGAALFSSAQAPPSVNGNGTLDGVEYVAVDLCTLAAAGCTPPCRVDYNRDGSVNPDDLGDFITGYFTEPPDPRADFNGDGLLNPDDLGDFITQFFFVSGGGACG